MSTRSCHDARRNFFIIGEGVMGLSTAWHLLNDERNYVTLCDSRDDLAPSQDVSKILRIDYPDPERMLEVMRSKSSWENDPMFNRHYKRTGRVVTYSKAHVETLLSIEHARSRLGLPPRTRQSAQLLEKLYNSAQVTSDATVVYNEDDGVMDWTEAMKSVKEDCLRKGGRFRDDRVVSMQVNGSGKVHTVVTSTESINTENTEIILAAGPWIMQLLEASSIQQPPPSRAPKATGIFSFSVSLSVEQWKRYSNLPVKSDIGVGEFLCHPSIVGSAKLTWIKPFRNPSGEKAISTPWDASETDLAVRSMLEARDWMRQGIPDLKGSGARIQSVHSWWDGVTDDQKPIITRHPQHQNLVIAGGGSYTHAKDLPDIGQIVVEVLGEKESHTQFGWAGSPDKSFNNQPTLQTDLNFRDLELEASKDERVQRWRETRSDWII